jgi:ABC-2 type transport system permease protein
VAAAQGGRVGGFSTADFATYYVALTLVSQVTQAWNAWDFEYEVRHGRLSPKLLRPLHPIHYSVVENLVWKVLTTVALVPALALVAWTFGARFTGEWWHAALFVPSVLLAAALRFVFGWVVAMLAFWTTRVQIAVHLVDRLSFIFAGQIAPLALMPGPFQAIAYGLPFGYMLGVPADILRGGLRPEPALLLMAGQAVWLGLSYAALQVAWAAGLRRYSAVGA